MSGKPLKISDLPDYTYVLYRDVRDVCARDILVLVNEEYSVCFNLWEPGTKFYKQSGLEIEPSNTNRLIARHGYRFIKLENFSNVEDFRNWICKTYFDVLL
jgi:hypothetical protein